MVLRVSIMDMKLAKEMLKEEDCSSFAIKRSSILQIHGLKRRAKKNNMQNRWKLN